MLVIAVVAIAEIAVRALLMERAGTFVAYMNVSNWLTVFLLGFVHGQRSAIPGRQSPWWRAGVSLAALVIAWSVLVGPTVVVDSFPFMRLGVPGAAGAVATSVAVTILYASVTLLTVATVSSLPAPAAVRYVARNTVIVFVAHMPIYYALHGPLKEFTSSYWLIVAIEMLPCYFALLWVSERIRSLVNPVALRERWLLAGPNFSSGVRDREDLRVSAARPQVPRLAPRE
jgi:hypothetical protein